MTRVETSILFRPGPAVRLSEQEPAGYHDLNLDQLVTRLTHRRDVADLAAWFHTLLPDPDDVAFRQAVFADLADVTLRESMIAHVTAMIDVRRWITGSQQAAERFGTYAVACRLEAMIGYARAAADLRGTLHTSAVHATALTAVAAYLDELLGSAAFHAWQATLDGLRTELAAVRYSVRVRGLRVTVSREYSADDYSDVVAKTFERFRQLDDAHEPARVPPVGMDHVAAQVLDRVAELYPDLFGRLRDFVTTDAEIVDPAVGRFTDEIQFYLAFQDLIKAAAHDGLAFTLPVIIDGGPQRIDVRAGFDLALAASSTDRPIVTNDAQLTADQHALVVTGPNQGGKSTYARTIGQVHVLAALGCPVPAREARVRLVDAVLTHFERQEDEWRDTGGGKLEDDLIRVHDLLTRTGPRTLLILNETFASTTLADAAELGGRILRHVRDLGAAAVFVTFVEELAASGDDDVVSMTSTTLPTDPTVRTFRIERRPPSGKLYAHAIAEHHALTRERILTRVAGSDEAGDGDRS